MKSGHVSKEMMEVTQCSDWRKGIPDKRKEKQRTGVEGTTLGQRGQSGARKGASEWQGLVCVCARMYTCAQKIMLCIRGYCDWYPPLTLTLLSY